jgi:prepilin-type N-terminal cleavage/methylation domain-containing protein
MRRANGFTLLEALAGMALAGILAGMGATRLPTLISGLRVNGAAHAVATTLRLARGRALAGGRAVEVRFDAPGASVETRWQAGATIELIRLPVGVGFAAMPASGRILMNGVGTAQNGTVTLGAGTSRRDVVVNQRGRVRVQ